MKFLYNTLLLSLLSLSPSLGQSALADPHQQKIIGDKWIEIGLPVLVIYLLVQSLLTVLKNNSDNRLKQMMIERGVSEETIREMMRTPAFDPPLQALKWALLLAGVGMGFLVIHYVFYPPTFASLAGILALYVSASFTVYYLIIRKRTR